MTACKLHKQTGPVYMRDETRMIVETIRLEIQTSSGKDAHWADVLDMLLGYGVSVYRRMEKKNKE